MHIHYHALRKIAAFISAHPGEIRFLEAYTQEKDQIVLGFAGPEAEFYLRVACAAPLPYVWPMHHANKARRNVLECFKQAYDQVLGQVDVVSHERVMLISLSGGYQLVLKMHGLLSNVLLLKDGMVVDRFRHNFEGDLTFVPVPGPFDAEWLSSAAHGEGLATQQRMQMISPIYDRRFTERCEHWLHQGLDFGNAFERMLAEAEDDTFYLVKDIKKLQFYLFPPEHGVFIAIQGIKPALDFFLRNWYQYTQYAQAYEQHYKWIQKENSRLTHLLESAEVGIKRIESERSPEEIGHLVMANLHLIQPGDTELETFDFYLNQPIKIKLKPELTGYQNAEHYYQKLKKHKGKVRNLQGQLEDTRTALAQVQRLLKEFRALPSPSELVLTEHGFDQGSLKALGHFESKHAKQMASPKEAAADRKHPFWEFECMGYSIFVGKNAKQNDELSFQFSRKNDIWLHARDAFGSHVIVRNPRDQELPKRVLEYAASLAAYHSKRKHESLVPVQYTPRKYIRKMKNGQPGQVIVEREKVIMIEPFAGFDQP